MEAYNWYQELIKPEWAPPSWVFGPVWTLLYIVIGVTFATVFYRAGAGQISYWVALPFIFNLIFNFAFTPLQFGLQSNALAALDILCILGTMVWAGIIIYPLIPWVLYANIPYFLWVSFATVLQLTITYLNWK